MIRLLLDQGLPRGTAADLRAAGFDAEHVGERAMAAATDAAIMGVAVAEGRAIVTLDSDFTTALARSRDTAPSVVFLRVEGLGRLRATALLRRILPELASDLAEGSIVVVDVDRMRIRKLPVVPD